MADVKELNINNTTYDIKAKTVVDQNGGSLKYWTGTRAQYDAIVTKDANTLYNITDDTDVTLTLLEALYPVGSIYIGTMATCPLATLGVGTWQLVAVDRVLQGATDGTVVGDLVEAGLPNITGQTPELATHMNTASVNLIKGAFSISNDRPVIRGWSGADANEFISYDFNAHNSSSIYGNSSTVQPPAYLVNIWERIS